MAMIRFCILWRNVMGIFSRIFHRSSAPAKPSPDAAAQTDGWVFDQPPQTAAITTRQVLEGHQEILAVVHYSDDHSWAFLCGTTDDAKDGRVVLMKTIVELDDSVRVIADLPPGWKAWRERRGAPWQKAENLEQG